VANEDTAETLDRMVSHLKANGVDLAKTPLALGPRLVLDPKTETFPDDPGACKLLTREYRKPFVVPAAGEV